MKNCLPFPGYREVVLCTHKHPICLKTTSVIDHVGTHSNTPRLLGRTSLEPSYVPQYYARDPHQCCVDTRTRIPIGNATSCTTARPYYSPDRIFFMALEIGRSGTEIAALINTSTSVYYVPVPWECKPFFMNSVKSADFNPMKSNQYR